jgi:hypothetical protein
VAGKFNKGHSKVNDCGLKGNAVPLFIKGSRFRETYFFSAGKKSKQKIPRLRLML